MARPNFKVTAKNRRLVAICAGMGTTHEEIAIALGISRSTLERKFADELTRGAYQKRAEVITALYRAALRGSAAACKVFLQFMPPAAVPPIERIGKKEQAQRDSKTAANGTDWENLLPNGKAH